MIQPGPKFRRRKAARPAEIVEAAMAVFAEKGFAAARLDEIAARAGVSKGAIYLYFPTKEEVFRAVVEQAVVPNVAALRAMLAMLASHPGPFTDIARAFALQVGQLSRAAHIGGVLKMVVAEARNFPEIARIWHDRLVAHAVGALTEAVAAAQARGEVRPGDPRAYALSMIAPLVVGVIWRETFVPVGAQPFDLPALLDQHVETLLRGMNPHGDQP